VTTALTRSGLTTNTARPRWNSVSSTVSESMSRSSRAVSSSSVASGTGGVSGLENVDRGRGRLSGEHLFGSPGLVALAPARRRVAEHLGTEPQDPVGERLGARGTSGDVDGDRQE